MGIQRRDDYWWVVRVGVSSQSADDISRRLFGAGCVGVWEQPALGEPELLLAYFTAAAAVDAAGLHDLLAAVLPADASFSIATQEDSDWMEAWKAAFGPTPLTPRWTVMPPWLAASGQSADVLIINPGTGFGTGTHETTRLAAALLEEQVVAGAGLLDVGTGSGILALLGARLGASPVLGLDVDADALENAAENRALNGGDDRIKLSLVPVGEVVDTFPVVVANIIAPVLLELAPAIAARVARSGRLILSGLLADQVDEVSAAYRAQGFVELRRTAAGEWRAGLWQRR
jgi:ribosomal protein L11 methyltransferase